ncbi:MAG TPA: hypothetical protein VE991_03250 [Acidimicrobiales bacterium]|nr:hypothetical protein [Acidimicrobiales bacterium]
MKRAVALLAVSAGAVTLSGCGSSSSSSQGITSQSPAAGTRQITIYGLAPGTTEPQTALGEDAATIRRRLQMLGLSGSSVTVAGNDIQVSTSPLSAAQSAFVGTTGSVLFRPVLCFADPRPPGAVSNAVSLPTGCSAPVYESSAANLSVDIRSGVPAHPVSPDPVLTDLPSSTPDFDATHPTVSVLLPAGPSPGNQDLRYLLGPAGVDGSSITKARVEHQSGAWTVLVDFSSDGARAWDRLAEQQFHAYVAVDVDGVVFSAPLVQPTNTSFTSFLGEVQISGALDQSGAARLAELIDSGPLAVPLVEYSRSLRP